MLLSEAFESYRSDVIVFQNQSKKTEENHLICMRSIILFATDIDIEDLTFATVRDWKINLEKSRSPETVRNYIIKLRVVLGFCYKRGINCLNPETVPVPKRGDKVPDFISEQDVSKLISACDTPRSRKINRLRNKAVIALLYASGIRVSELCRLDRSDIRQDCTFTVIGKGNKARLCFIDQRTKRYLDEYARARGDQNTALIVSDNGGLRITPGGVQEIFKFARKNAGFTTPIHPHTMRHSFATNLLGNNTNLRYVQVMLGHSSIQTTQMYTHVRDLDLQKVYNEHHSI